MKLEIKEQLSNHMKYFGIHMLAKGLVTATFNEYGNPYGHSMSVIQVAHGAELVIKAKIAEEHPLLIFANLPKSANSIDTVLGIEDLLNKGKTIMYSELHNTIIVNEDFKAFFNNSIKNNTNELC